MCRLTVMTTSSDSKQKVIIISLEEDVSEIIQLAKSLEYHVVDIFLQQRNHPDVASYIGFGKLEEIKNYILESPEVISIAIVDGELKPSQWFLLEKKFSITVYDRIRLILDIFKDRADRKEARLQVRLAELEYEKPFVRELIHRTRSGEHPGLMAGGEYQVDDYYEMIKKQMKLIRHRLEKIRTNRSVTRQHRHTSGFYLVSLVGYTNAGKSSLLQSLTNEIVYVDNRLFSTLSPLTRRFSVQNIPILLTDTVGFIQRLPSWIIDAFHSTLEEIQEADVVLLIVDGSDSIEAIDLKIQTSFDELASLQVTSPIILVLNKIDLMDKDSETILIEQVSSFPRLSEIPIVPISVKKQMNYTDLINNIYKNLPKLSDLVIQLPNTTEAQSFLSFLYDKTKVKDVVYSNQLQISLLCNPTIRIRILTMCKKLDGVILKDSAL